MLWKVPYRRDAVCTVHFLWLEGGGGAEVFSANEAAQGTNYDGAPVGTLTYYTVKCVFAIHCTAKQELTQRTNCRQVYVTGGQDHTTERTNPHRVEEDKRTPR